MFRRKKESSSPSKRSRRSRSFASRFKHRRCLILASGYYEWQDTPHAGAARRERFRAVASGDGAIIYKHACALGYEGIVSKRLGSAYRSGRAVGWLKVKNPAAPAVTRETDEEWNTFASQR